MAIDPNIAKTQAQYNAQHTQLGLITAQYGQRLAAIAAQQQATQHAQAAASAQEGAARAQQYHAATAGTLNDLRSNGGGIFAGMVGQANNTNAGNVAATNANDAAYQQQVGAANKAAWDQRTTGVSDLQNQGTQSLYQGLLDQQDAIKQAEAASSGGGGGGGGGGYGGGGGGYGGSGSYSTTEADAAYQAEHPFNYKGLALSASEGTAGGRKVIGKIIGNHSPADASRLYRTAVDRWNYNKAHHVKNGVSLHNLKRVLGSYKKSTYGYKRQQYTNARNAYKYGG